MAKTIKRIPYYLKYLLGVDCGTDIMLGKTPGGWLEKNNPFPIPEEMGEFIVKYTVCAKCGRNFNSPLKPCRCRQKYEEERFDDCIIIARIIEKDTDPFGIYIKKWRPIIEREGKRVTAYNRKQRLKGSINYTKSEIDVLFNVQNGRCYYCGCKISDIKNNKNKYHIDHYQSIYDGGSNAITNIVLSCPSCNWDKGIEDGYSYRTKAIRRADQEHKVVIRNVRKEVDKFWNEQE